MRGGLSAAALSIAFLLLLVMVPLAGATQELGTQLERIGVPENPNLNVNEADDKRVDVDIAVVDTGIDPNDPEVNVAASIDCEGAQAPDYECTTFNEGEFGHGSGVARGIGALDNDVGGVGVAPGARVWFVQQEEYLNGPGPYVFNLTSAIASIKWVTEHAGTIEVAVLALACTTEEPPPETFARCSVEETDEEEQVVARDANSADFEELEEALTESMQAGVVWVVPAGNWQQDVAELSPQRMTPTEEGGPKPIIVSAVADTDGKPGSEEDEGACSWADDAQIEVANWGSAIDVAGPGCVGSAVYPLVGGAAALLASGDPPEDGKDVAAIRDAMRQAGAAREEQYEEALTPEELKEKPYWVDSPSKDIEEPWDGVKEPFLYVGDPEVFDPRFTPPPPAFSHAISESGSEPGQLNLAFGITTDAEGDVWTTEAGTHRVQQFDAEGNRLSGFGEQGAQPGQFDVPFDLDIDPQGDVWVADAFNGRVQELSTEGEPLSEIEGLQLPVGIAIDPQGDVWVADLLADRVYEFGPEGEQISEIGTTGSGPGELDEPTSVAIDPQGDVWVAEQGNDRLQELDPEGDQLSEFGEEGPSGGQFDEPTGIDIDQAGNLWVADQGNSRIQVLGPDGDFLTQFGEEGSGEGQLSWPSDVAIGPEGEVWVADTANGRVQGWVSTPSFSHAVAESGSEPGQLAVPFGLTTDSQGDLWVADSGNGRIQQFDAKGDPISEFGKWGVGEGEMRNPMGLTLGPEGDVWVADGGNGRIQRFSPEGKALDEIKGFAFPVDVTFDAEGNYWVADFGADSVTKFDPEGTQLAEVGEPGSGEGQLDGPADIAIDSQGDIWVADGENDRLQEFSPGGEVLSEIGEEGSAGGQFSFTGGIAIDRMGNLWVADQGNSRIQVLGPDGDTLTQFGEEGSGEGQLSWPSDVVLDGDGGVWIADSANGRVQGWVR